MNRAVARSPYEAAEANVNRVMNNLNNLGPNMPVHQATFDVQAQQAFATAALTQAVLAVADELRKLREGPR